MNNNIPTNAKTISQNAAKKSLYHKLLIKKADIQTAEFITAFELTLSLYLGETALSYQINQNPPQKQLRTYFINKTVTDLISAWEAEIAAVRKRTEEDTGKDDFTVQLTEDIQVVDGTLLKRPTVKVFCNNAVNDYSTEDIGENFAVIFTVNKAAIDINIYFQESLNCEFANEFLRVLKSNIHCVLETPMLPIDEVKFLHCPAEPHTLNSKNYPCDKSIPELFREVVKSHEENIAIRYENTKLSYAELDGLSKRFQNCLEAYGVKTNDVVVIILEPSLELIISLLGVLRSGCTYVTIDPAYPQKRITQVIGSANAKYVVTRTNTAAVASNSDATAVYFDGLAYLDHYPEDAVTRPASDVAHIYFTSGSTGLPKGVKGTHKGVINRSYWLKEIGLLEESDIFCLRATVNFIISSLEFYTPLLHGAQLVILPSSATKDPERLLDYIAKYQITHLGVVPSLLKLLLAQGPNLEEKTKSLRLIEVGGEAPSREDMMALKRRLPSPQLMQRYGSSELTASICCLLSEHQLIHRHVPIGYPIANTQAYVLDKQLRRLPPFVQGELYIDSISVTQGYLEGAEADKKIFIKNPFRPKINDQLYRTGDLVYRRPNGELAVTGRQDFQVNINGHRIELQEIEFLLTRHRAIKQAVASVQREQLTAHLVLNADTAKPTPKMLYSYLADYLPSYMQPKAYVILESIPLLGNGKIDRGSIQKSSAGELLRAGDYTPAANEYERSVKQLWENTLGLLIGDISVTEDFHSLGANSISIIKLMIAMRAEFGISIDYTMMMKYPTIRSQAEMIESFLNEKKTRLAFPIRVSGGHTLGKSGIYTLIKEARQKNIAIAVENNKLLVDVPERFADDPILAHIEAARQKLAGVYGNTAPATLPAGSSDKNSYGTSSAQKRMFYNWLLNPSGSQYNISRIWKFNTCIDHERLQRAITKLVHRHASLRTVFFLDQEGEIYQKITIDRPIDFQSLTVTGDVTHEDLKKLVFQAFDLLEKPCFRVCAIHNEKDSVSYLAISMHHIIADEQSLTILKEDLQTLLDESNAPFNESQAQYIDHCLWEQNWLNSPEAKIQLEFWKEMLLDCRPFAAKKPAGKRSIKSQPAYDGLSQSSDTLNQLLVLSHEYKLSLFSTLLWTMGLCLHIGTDKREIFIGAPVVARPLSSMERVVGYFSNTVLFFLKDLHTEKPLAAIAEQVASTTAEVLDNQLLPYQNIVDELKLSQRFGNNPLLNVVITLRDGKGDNLYFGSQLGEKMRLEADELKFDLFLIFSTTGDSIKLMVEYDESVYSRNNIQNLIQCYSLVVKHLHDCRSMTLGQFIEHMTVISYDIKNFIGSL